MRIRNVITISTIGILISLVQSYQGLSVSFAQEQNVKPIEVTVEEWMDKWMGLTKAPVGALHLSRFKGPIYFLTKSIGWKPNTGQEVFNEIHVPKGFVTDLTSIPQIFWSILRPDGEYTYPAIIHDFLYWTQTLSREEADMVFKLSMEDFGISTAKSFVIYEAVRLGGQSAWDENTKLKALGENRILKRFPQDPRTQWEDWKKRTDVFVK